MARAALERNAAAATRQAPRAAAAARGEPSTAVAHHPTTSVGRSAGDGNTDARVGDVRAQVPASARNASAATGQRQGAVTALEETSAAVRHRAALGAQLRASDGHATPVATTLAQHAATTTGLRCRAGAALEQRAAAVADGAARRGGRAARHQAAACVVLRPAPSGPRQAAADATAPDVGFATAARRASAPSASHWLRGTLTAHDDEGHRDDRAPEDVPHFTPARKTSNQVYFRHSATAWRHEDTMSVVPPRRSLQTSTHVRVWAVVVERSWGGGEKPWSARRSALSTSSRSAAFESCSLWRARVDLPPVAVRTRTWSVECLLWRAET